MSKKLTLNKKVISGLTRSEMETIKGGVRWEVFTISVHSCARGTSLGKACCKTEFGEVAEGE